MCPLPPVELGEYVAQEKPMVLLNAGVERAEPPKELR
jgi:hypothetical protein